MGWYQYYKLLEQYDGDLNKASIQEMNEALKGNPNTPDRARQIAEQKYKEKYNLKGG
jgi:hypothetical protein